MVTYSRGSHVVRCVLPLQLDFKPAAPLLLGLETVVLSSAL